MLTVFKSLVILIKLPFKGSSPESGFALPMAIGAASIAGAGLVYVNNRMDEAEMIMDRQLSAQTARSLAYQVERVAASSTALKGSAKLASSDLAKCLKDGSSCSAHTTRSAEHFAGCVDKESNVNKDNCLGGIFPKKLTSGVIQSNVDHFTLYNSKTFLDGLNNQDMVSGAYTKYGAKCELGSKVPSCGRVYVKTKFAVDCAGECIGEDSIRRLMILYAVYNRQVDGSYTAVARGGAEPSLANCEEKQYLAGLDTTTQGTTFLNCVDLPPINPISPKDQGPNGNIGPRGPRGKDQPPGPRGDPGIASW